MKTISKYFFLAVAACLSLTACESMLELQPEGATKTDELKQDAYGKLPENAIADVNAMYAQMIELYAGGTTNHNDFGVASCMMLLECEGQDWIGPNIGYNWFNYSDFYTRNYNSGASLMVWKTFYKTIKAANNVCASIDEKTEDQTAMQNLGQARAVRAYMYTLLAQMYQFTYNEANASKPCVPIVYKRVVDGELLSSSAEENPRATVQEVYDFIMADLNYAVAAMEGFEGADKGVADQAVAYGLRARVNLLLGNYADAAKDAAKAIEVSGAQSYTLAEVSKPTFCHAEANSVIWANMIVESNDIVQTGIINWPSHMSSLFLDGYTGVGAWRSISSELYDKISATDVRKGWWLDENMDSPNLHGNVYELYVGQGEPYVNVKFGVPNDDMTNLVADADWTLMRYEEMLLVQAEGLARSGQEAAAKALLEGWVTVNRDPSYTCKATSATDLVEEIWKQRRIELWGEGFAWFDLNRLEKPIVRSTSSNWPAAWVVDVPANHDCRIWTIPQSEVEANGGIDESDNNPVGDPF